MSRRALVALAFAVWALAPALAAAQPLGLFQWQLQPYCNIISVVVTATGPIYTLQGTDDQCGGPRRASVTGTAFLNPDGTIGIGFTIIGAPGGLAGHIDATVTLPTASGTWRDSSGASGAFVLTPGAGVPGSPRPLSTPITASHTRVGNYIFSSDGLLPLNDAQETSITFTLNADEPKVLTFSAECAVKAQEGVTGSPLTLDILHNGVAVPPTAGKTDVFCDANGTASINDGLAKHAITVVVPAVAGANTISISTSLLTGATAGRIGSSSLVIR